MKNLSWTQSRHMHNIGMELFCYQANISWVQSLGNILLFFIFIFLGGGGWGWGEWDCAVGRGVSLDLKFLNLIKLKRWRRQRLEGSSPQYDVLHCIPVRSVSHHGWSAPIMVTLWDCTHHAKVRATSALMRMCVALLPCAEVRAASLRSNSIFRLGQR